MTYKALFRILGREQIVYVMSDDALFAPGRYPDGDEDPPVMEDLLKAPEGADLHGILRVKEYNMKVVTRYETRQKDYYARVNFHERDIQRAIAMIQMGLGTSCPAQVLVEKAITNQATPYSALRAALKALDKFANVLSS